MPFNSDSYYRNKWRREAMESLSRAREIKAQPPEPILIEVLGYDPRPADIEFHAKRARTVWRLYLSQREICRLK